MIIIHETEMHKEHKQNNTKEMADGEKDSGGAYYYYYYH